MIGLAVALGGYYLLALALYAAVKPPPDNPWYALLYTTAQVIGFVLLLAITRAEGYGTWSGAFRSIYTGGLGRREILYAFAALGAAFMLWWPINLMLSALGMSWPKWGYSTSGLNAVPVAIWALGAAFFEEGFFRGYSIPRLNKAVGTAGALLITSAASAAIHLRFGPALSVYIFFWALIAGGLFLYTKSTWSCFLYHAANNVIVDFLIYGR
ncbi:MAG: CPBP family intramembrane glutamic endopeptidase [Pyrobaculum sp.]